MKKILCVLCGVILGLLGLVTGCDKGADKGTAMNDTFYNPIRIEKNMGDPWLYYHDGYYYYMSSGGTQIKVTKSKWMTQVVENVEDENVTKVIFRQKSINVVEIWAPEIFFFEGRWYVYFTATTDSSDTLEKDGNRRIYGIRSKTDDAMGEWETAVRIDLPLNYRAIDATFMDYGGKQYIIWSGWPSAENQGYKQNLYITELETGNPLKAKSLEDDRRVLISQPLYAWETKGAVQNEGPAVCFSPEGTPFVLFSGSYSGGDGYCIGYLELTGDPMREDGWTKSESPLMATDMQYSEVIAPGHCSGVKSPEGTETWVCYH
ncbi:MAG: family 43 glycosylhydrolase, partial [Candidatus Gallimonas sp.]